MKKILITALAGFALVCHAFDAEIARYRATWTAHGTTQPCLVSIYNNNVVALYIDGLVGPQVSFDSSIYGTWTERPP